MGGGGELEQEGFDFDPVMGRSNKIYRCYFYACLDQNLVQSNLRWISTYKKVTISLVNQDEIVAIEWRIFSWSRIAKTYKRKGGFTVRANFTSISRQFHVNFNQ